MVEVPTLKPVYFQILDGEGRHDPEHAFLDHAHARRASLLRRLSREPRRRSLAEVRPAHGPEPATARTPPLLRRARWLSVSTATSSQSLTGIAPTATRGRDGPKIAHRARSAKRKRPSASWRGPLAPLRRRSQVERRVHRPSCVHETPRSLTPWKAKPKPTGRPTGRPGQSA